MFTSITTLFAEIQKTSVVALPSRYNNARQERIMERQEARREARQEERREARQEERREARQEERRELREESAEVAQATEHMSSVPQNIIDLYEQVQFEYATLERVSSDGASTITHPEPLLIVTPKEQEKVDYVLKELHAAYESARKEALSDEPLELNDIAFFPIDVIDEEGNVVDTITPAPQKIQFFEENEGTGEENTLDVNEAPESEGDTVSEVEPIFFEQVPDYWPIVYLDEEGDTVSGFAKADGTYFIPREENTSSDYTEVPDMYHLEDYVAVKNIFDVSDLQLQPTSEFDM